MEHLWWVIATVVLAGYSALIWAWGWWKGSEWGYRQPRNVRRTDLTQTSIEPERNGQRITRGPNEATTRQRKTFSAKRRGGTEAHMSQPRKNW